MNSTATSSYLNSANSKTATATSTAATTTTATSTASNINKPLTNYTDLIKEINLIGKIKLTLFDGIGVSKFDLFFEYSLKIFAIFCHLTKKLN